MGAFTSLYAGIAGFLVALVAGLFIVFALAGRKKPLEESEEKESAGEESGEEAEETEGKPKPPKTKGGKQKKKR
jgi:H+/gluconate symporter-like permease